MTEHIHNWSVSSKIINGMQQAFCQCGEMKLYPANLEQAIKLQGQTLFKAFVPSIYHDDKPNIMLRYSKHIDIPMQRPL